MFFIKLSKFLFVGGILLFLGVNLWLTESKKEEWLFSQMKNYEKVESKVKNYWQVWERGGIYNNISSERGNFLLENGKTYFSRNLSKMKSGIYKQPQTFLTLWVLKNAGDRSIEIFQMDVGEKRILSFEQTLLKEPINKGLAYCLIIIGLVVVLIGIAAGMELLKGSSN